MDVRKNIVVKENNIRKWIAKLGISQNKLGNHSICPFAISAKITIQEVSNGNITPIDGVDVAIFILDDDLSLKQIEDECKRLNNTWKDYIFLDDHKDDPTYINGVQSNNGEYNLILAQRKDKLVWARNMLKKTDYYKYWSEDLYNKIIKG